MYAHVHTLRFLPDALDAWIERCAADAGRRLSGVAGLVSALVLAEREVGLARLVTIWRTPADRERGVVTIMPSELDGLVQPVEDGRFEVAQFAGQPGGKVARVFDALLQPGAAEQVIAIFQNIVLHAATGQSGFQRGILLLDRATNRGI